MKGDVQTKEELLEEKIEKHYPRLIQFCCRLMGSADQGKDLAQITIEKAIQDHSRFDGSRKYYTWFCQLAKARSRSMRQDLGWRRKHLRCLEDDDITDPTHAEDEMINAQAEQTARRIVEDAINDLKPHEREAIELREIQGRSYAEISKELDVPLTTVKMRLFYGRQKLKEMLTGE